MIADAQSWFQKVENKLKEWVGAPIVQAYMKSDFFVSNTAIPLWDPYPGVNSASVGDVGFFTRDGGFEVLFNVFLTHTENKKLGFDPPDGFEPYGPVGFYQDVSKITRVSCTSYFPYRGDFAPDPEIPHHPKRLAPSICFRLSD
jgi:hypothetical protein